MKKLVTTSLLIVAAATAASAQTEKGSLIVGSNLSQLSYRSSNEGVAKQFSFGITPTVGLFIVNRLALGAEINLAYSHLDNSYNKTNVFEYRAAPFVRYYLTDAPKHKFFGQASYGITGYSAKTESSIEPHYTSKGSYQSLGLSLGYNYFISPMVALEVQPYYHRNETQVVSDTGANDWGISVGFQIFFPKSSSAAQ
jgi:hypothetical protein